MKKIVLLFVFMFSAVSSFAQQPKNSITVSGVHTYDPRPVFTVKMNLTTANVYYDGRGITLEKIKKEYYDNLTKNNVDTKKLKENKLEFALRGYQKDGITLEYTTTSKEELLKFLEIQSIGVTKQEVSNTSTLNYDTVAKYSKLAFEDAEAKAKVIAKSLGKKLGSIIHYTDSNRKKIVDYAYDTKNINSREYHIGVTFELVD